jgi:hypothetical protein
LCALYKAYARRRAWKAIRDSLLHPCSLSRDDRGRKIRNRKQGTDVGKYSFVNRTIKDWKSLPAGIPAPSRRRVREAVTSKEALGGNK